MYNPKPKLDGFALMKSTTERLEAIFKKEDLSDVVFLVGPEDEQWRYPAHKFLFMLASPVFRVMFGNDFAESKEKPEVSIPDVKPSAFDLMLKYIYTSVVHFTSVREALDTLYAAQKYMMHHLSLCCLEHLEREITCENVLEIYQEVKMYDLELGKGSVILKCLRTIDTDANIILKSAMFGNIGLDLVKEILSRSFLNLSSELIVFEALLFWATQECHRRHFELTEVNKKLVLTDALYMVLYPSMTDEEFFEGPAASGLLSSDECNALLGYRVTNDPQALALNLHAGNISWKRKLYNCNQINLTVKKAMLEESHCQETLLLATDQEITLIGFEVFSLKSIFSGKYTKGLLLFVTDMHDNIFGKVHWRDGVNVDVTDGRMYVELPSSIFLKSKKKYKIQLFLPTSQYHLGQNVEGVNVINYDDRTLRYVVKYFTNNMYSMLREESACDFAFAELDLGGDEVLKGNTVLSLFYSIDYYM